MSVWHFCGGDEITLRLGKGQKDGRQKTPNEVKKGRAGRMSYTVAEITAEIAMLSLSKHESGCAMLGVTSPPLGEVAANYGGVHCDNDNDKRHVCS